MELNNSFFLMLCVGLLGYAVTFFFVPKAKLLARVHGIVSRPGGHSRHARPIPMLGGLSIYFAFATAFALYFAYDLIAGPPYPEPSRTQMLSLFIGSTWMVLLGTIDDKIRMRWKVKLLGEILGVLILLLGGHGLLSATIPFMGVVHFGWWGIPLFALVVLTITNAINLIDGIDGLAGGICFFAALVSGIIGLSKGDMFTATIAFAVCGGLVGFLRFNFPPASIFMGDGGSLMLGFLLGTLATSSAAPEPGQRSGTMVMLMAPFFPFGIALLDVMLSIVRRAIAGQKVFLPDTNHLHHRLMETIGRPRAVVSILYGFSALLSAMTLTLVLGPKERYFTVYVVLSGMVLIAMVVMVLRLYLTEGIPQIIQNRPHFQFLATFISFMNKRVKRASNRVELLELLEAGIRDLDFDLVRVTRGEETLFSWRNPRPVHVGSPREERRKRLGKTDLEVMWVVPGHSSVSYQKYLKLSWDVFIQDVEARLAELHESPEERTSRHPASESLRS